MLPEALLESDGLLVQKSDCVCSVPRVLLFSEAHVLTEREKETEEVFFFLEKQSEEKEEVRGRKKGKLVSYLQLKEFRKRGARAREN